MTRLNLSEISNLSRWDSCHTKNDSAHKNVYAYLWKFLQHWSSRKALHVASNDIQIVDFLFFVAFHSRSFAFVSNLPYQNEWMNEWIWIQVTSVVSHVKKLSDCSDWLIDLNYFVDLLAIFQQFLRGELIEMHCSDNFNSWTGFIELHCVWIAYTSVGRVNLIFHGCDVTADHRYRMNFTRL